MVTDGTRLWFCGTFTQVAGQSRNRVASADLATGTLDAWNPQSNGQVSALALSGTTLYLGGSFTMLGTTARNRIAAVDAFSAAVQAWDPNANSSVGVLAVSGGVVYSVGSFGMIGGQSRNGLAALDGATGLATTWNPNPDIGPSAIEIVGGTAYVGGVFSSIGGASRSKLAAIELSSGLATSWNPGLTGVNVVDIEVKGSSIIAAGEFWTVGGIEHRNLAAIVDPGQTVSAPLDRGAVAGLALAPFVPNPAAGRVRVTFSLPRAGRVELVVHDVLGRRVGTPLDGAWFPAGPHTFDWDTAALPPGVYHARLATEAGVVTRRLVRVGP
jgi:hypothetical protein